MPSVNGNDKHSIRDQANSCSNFNFGSGPANTYSNDQHPDLRADFVMANRPTSIIQRAASMEEVANMVVYVVSPQASATTGAALRVDGGVVDTIA